MSYHVRMNVSRDDTGWGVDIWINGAFHDRVPADNEDEAKRMLVALVDMTIEESADWRGGPLGRKELMDSRKAAMVTIQPRQTASGRWAVRTVVEADGQRHEFDTAEGLNEVDAMTNAVKLSEALRALGGPVKLLGAPGMTVVSISREVDDSGRWHVVVSVDGQVAEDLDARDEAHSRRIYDDIKLLAQTAGGQVTSEYPGRNN